MTVSFPDHLALLTGLLDRQQAIVEQIEGRLLNVQGKETARNRNRAYFDRLLASCVYDGPGVHGDGSRLKDQLAAARVADGFEPVLVEQASHQLDPLELIVRAYEHWERRRWPGRNGRLSYARVLFTVFVLRQLEALSLRVWDDGTDRAGERAQAIKAVLDRLNGDAADPGPFLRDARWLLQTAQGPLTRHLAPYFRTAERIAGSFTAADRLEVHRAGALLAGGHLRSQLRRRCAELGRPADDPAVLAITRNSNSMDAALLIRDLVPLLSDYTEACAAGDAGRRLGLADAILQAVSADPELFVTRLDLLGPGTLIETLFVERDAQGRAGWTDRGLAQLDLLERYGRLLGVAAPALEQDAGTLDPAGRRYSPLGIVYGFCGDILSNMALGVLHGQPGHGVSLEDLFDSRGEVDRQLACARGWEQLSRREGEHFEYSAGWADEMHRRMLAALRLRAAYPGDANATSRRAGRLLVAPANAVASPSGAADAVAAQEHCLTSDVSRALASGATAFPKSQILSDRNEGRFLASAETDGKWFAVSKTILSEVIGRDRDALITDVPEPVLQVLQLTCSGLLTAP